MIDELLAYRLNLDRLAATVPTHDSRHHREYTDLQKLVVEALATGEAKVVATVLSGQNALLLPLQSIETSDDTLDGGQAWRETNLTLDSGAIVVTAEGPSGLKVTVESKALSAEKQDSEAERARLALAHALQLADRSVSNPEATALAEAALLQVHAVVGSLASLLSTAATGALKGNHTGPNFERLVFDVPKRKAEKMTCRALVGAWGGGAYGLGLRFTIRAKVKVLLREEGRVGAVEAGKEPLEEVGQYHCTLVCGRAVLPGGFLSEYGTQVAKLQWQHHDDHELPVDEWADCAMMEGLAEEEEVRDDEQEAEEDERGEEPSIASRSEASTARQASRRSLPLAARHGGNGACELMAWGDNEHGELSDLRHTVVPAPSLLNWRVLAPWEQVRRIATSARHTLVCSSVGSLYSCGDSSDGALGHGDVETCRSLKLVAWFADVSLHGVHGVEGAVEVVEVGAGADLFGSHSAAVDSQGRVYTWGLGSACGRGNRKPGPTPGLVPIADHDAVSTSTSNEDDADGSSSGGGLSGTAVGSVSCGGGYCMAIARDRKSLWGWGNWTGGRLGFGPVPSVQDTSYMHAGTRKRLLPLRLRPKEVPLSEWLNANCDERIAGVSCGDAHTCLTLESGKVLVWGSNESGQLGLGPSPHTGRFETSFWPTPLPLFHGAPNADGGVGSRTAFGSGASGSTSGRRAAGVVACGAAHCVAMDRSGEVWAWGGLGGACLGLPVDLPWGGRARHTLRPTSELQAARAVRQRGNEPTVEVPPWSVPRRVPAWSNCGAVSASCGERHSVVQLKCGRALFCGDGIALAHELGHQTSSAKDNDENEYQSARSPEAVLEALESEEPTLTPRLPGADFFPALEGKHIALVACGGQHTLILSRGEILGLGLGQQLLHAALKRTQAPMSGHGGRSTAGSDDDDDDEDEDEASGSGVSLGSLAGLGLRSYDCVLLTAGARVGAHKVILARRSRVLRELIAEEERPPVGGSNASGLLELLVPELKADTARALCEFLYTDQVKSLPPGSALPLDLYQAAERFELPRLKALAKIALPPSALPPLDNSSFDDDDDDGQGEIGRDSVPASTLASDLGSLLGDRLAWADLKLVAGGRTIYAHRAVLAAASSYFRAMFRAMASLHEPRSSSDRRGGDDEDDDEDDEEGSAGPGVLEIVVPDSYVGMLRVLLWVYTGKLEEGNFDSMLEDLIAADRFQLLCMKRACESAVVVDASNCVAALEIATVTNASRLAQEAQRVVALSLHEPEVEAAVVELVARHPILADTLFTRLTQVKDAQTRDKHHAATVSRVAASEEERIVETHRVFPIGPMIAMLGCAGAFAFISNFAVLGPLVPVINAIGLAGLLVWGFRTMKDGA